MKVSDVLSEKGRKVHQIEAVQPITAALELFATSKVRSVVVTTGDRAVVGILTIRDVVAHLVARGGEGLVDSVEQAMTREVTTVDPSAAVVDVEQIFRAKQINHIPVVEHGKLVGVLTPADVFARHLRSVQEVNQHLIDYISGQ